MSTNDYHSLDEDEVRYGSYLSSIRMDTHTAVPSIPRGANVMGSSIKEMN